MKKLFIWAIIIGALPFAFIGILIIAGIASRNITYLVSTLTLLVSLATLYYYFISFDQKIGLIKVTKPSARQGSSNSYIRLINNSNKNIIINRITILKPKPCRNANCIFTKKYFKEGFYMNQSSYYDEIYSLGIGCGGHFQGVIEIKYKIVWSFYLPKIIKSDLYL